MGNNHSNSAFVVKWFDVPAEQRDSLSFVSSKMDGIFHKVVEGYIVCDRDGAVMISVFLALDGQYGDWMKEFRYRCMDPDHQGFDKTLDLVRHISTSKSASKEKGSHKNNPDLEWIYEDGNWKKFSRFLDE